MGWWECLLSIVGAFSVIANLQTSRRFASSSTVDCGCGSLAAQNHLVTLETRLVRVSSPGSWVFAPARNSRLQAVDTHYPPPSQPASCANFTDVLISFHKSRPQIKMPFVCKLSVEILFACSHTSILYVAMSCPEPSSWGSGFSVPDENSWKLQLFKSFAWKLIFILELMDNFHKLTGFRIFN